MSRCILAHVQEVFSCVWDLACRGAHQPLTDIVTAIPMVHQSVKLLVLLHALLCYDINVHACYVVGCQRSELDSID